MRDRRKIPEQDKKSFFIKKYANVSGLEKDVDRVVHDSLIKKQSEELNVETFSLKDKSGEVIYFLKEKSKKKSKSSNQEILSNKIISEARHNLGEKPVEKKEFDDNANGTKVETRKKIGIGRGKVNFDKHEEIATEIDNKFGGKKTGEVSRKEEETIDKKIAKNFEKKKSDDAASKSSESDELLLDKVLSESKIPKSKKTFFRRGKDKKSKEIDVKGFISENKKLEPEKSARKHIVNAKGISEKEIDILDKGIEQANETPLPFEENELAESKALKLAKEHQFFNDNKNLKEDKKSKEAGIKSFTAANENESKTLDKKISETSVSGQQTVQLEKPKKKKSFFKKKEPEPSISFEETKTEEKPTLDSEPMMTELKFKVENIPTIEKIGEDESKLVDKKIMETSEEKQSDGEKKIGEVKATKLAKEHIKNRVVEKPANVKEKESFLKPMEISPNSTEEHVFFDEDDASFDGWSPKVTEKDRRTIELDVTGTPEIDPDSFKYDKDVDLPKEVLQSNSVKLSDLGFSENEWEELDFYPLCEPFAYVEILREKETLDKCYFLVEADLTDDEQKNLEFILDTMSQSTVSAEEIDERGEDEYLSAKITQAIQEYNLIISDASRDKIQYYIEKASLGLGKIAPILKDPNIEDISCDGANVSIFLYHRKFGSLKSNVKFDDEDELSGFVFRLAQKCGKHISIAEPMLDATMPDGSRIQMTLSSEVTTKGSTFTIRKFREDPFSPPDLVEFNTMSSEVVAYFWLAVENGVNTLFAGGTASGKTTALNALSLFIPRESKIVSIEETREINLPHPNWIPGVSRAGFGEVVADKSIGEIDLYDLMKAALRQRPEYILVGEIRGKEAYVLFQAMATGHATYSTVHADSAQSLIHRLEGKPIEIPRVMLQSLDIVSLHITTRVKSNRARRCKQVIEIIDIDPTTKEILTNEVFRWDPVDDKFIYSGKSYVLERIRADKDMSREEMTTEIKNRTRIIEWMNNTNVREFHDVASIVSRYGETPDDVLKRVDKDSG